MPFDALGAPEEVARGVHSGLGSALRPADARQLGLVLDPAAPVEELAVGRQLDAALAQEIGQLQRKRVRHDRLGEPDVLDTAHRELEVDLPVLLPGVEQLVEAEAERRDQLGVDTCFLQARPFEIRDDDVAASVLLHVEERIAERQRHLVAQLGMADRVAVDEHVGHEQTLEALTQ